RSAQQPGEEPLARLMPDFEWRKVANPGASLPSNLAPESSALQGVRDVEKRRRERFWCADAVLVNSRSDPSGQELFYSRSRARGGMEKSVNQSLGGGGSSLKRRIRVVCRETGMNDFLNGEDTGTR